MDTFVPACSLAPLLFKESYFEGLGGSYDTVARGKEKVHTPQKIIESVDWLAYQGNCE